MEQLNNISTDIMIIIGTIVLVLGSIGNILNICVFAIWSRSSQLRNPNNNVGHKSNTPLYLLTSSCANLLVIIYPLLTRILFDGYKFKATYNTVFILCKLRFYVLYTFDFISITCTCMATLDRYLISSREVRLRRLSTTRQRTKYIILTIICLFGLHNIPLIIYFDISNLGQCIIYSISYSYYYLYVFQISLHGIIPICFLSVFGILTYKQLRMIKGQKNLNIDKQFSRMLLSTSIATIFSAIPYCIEQIFYIIVGNSNSYQSSYVFLYHVISNILFYTNPVSSFYIYYFSTPNFRNQIQKIVLCKNHGRCLTLTNNQVATIIPNIIQNKETGNFVDLIIKK